MAVVTYTAKREIEKTGFLKSGTDFQAIASDDSIDAATTDLSGLLTDQWLQAAGFVKNAGWFQIKSNSTSAKVLTLTPPVTHLRLPGVSGNDATTPDTVANSIAGDIDIRMKVSLVDWTPGAVERYLFNKGTSSKSWIFGIGGGAGGLIFYTSTDGTNWDPISNSHPSTVPQVFVDGSAQWIRVTRASSTGDVKYYTSSDGVVWTQLGTTVSGTSGALFNNSQTLDIWGWDQLGAGRVYYAELRSGIDGSIVAAFDPTRGTRGAGSFVAATGETWTINASGTPPAMLQGPRIFDEGAQYLSNVTGDVTTPDTASVSITGDIDLRAKIAPTDWTATGLTQEIIDKSTTDSSQFAYLFRLEQDAKLSLYWSENGSALKSATSTVALTVTDGIAKWVRAVLDVNNGAAGNDAKFYWSDDYDPYTGAGTWTQLGATVTTATATSIFDSTATLRVGTRNAGSSPLIGKIYYAEVRNGIGGPVVAAFDPGRAAAGASSLVAYTGETWTINAGATLVRVTPVTLTGYKRGLGQSYSIEFKAEQADRKVKVKRSEQQPIDPSKPPETLLYGQRTTVDMLTEILDETTQLPQFREFLASVSAGEVFTFDRYGTIAVPVDPRQAQLDSADYDEKRVMTSLRQRVAFTARLLS